MSDSNVPSGADPAHHPDVFRARGQTRPLTNREYLQRTAALCAAIDPHKLSCSGQVFVGLFFDGTGNNEHNDYVAPKIMDDGTEKIGTVADRKHSNIVRLYHAHHKAGMVGATGYFPYYIPGVGTPFPEIGDSGEGSAKTAGGAMAWNGEARVIWGLIQIFNAVSLFATKTDLIKDEQAKAITSGLGGLGSVGAQRRWALGKTWTERLKTSITGLLPKVEQINLSVFGFSRGAAQARACVNWLYELCEQKDGGYTLAGIPLRVQFMGLLDTVASVGVAGMYSITEGRQSWADDNMQVHPGVEQCVHFVAAHEARACFPLDSVRIGERYPPNAKEYVYPGVHSDVGGGYHPKAQGKSADISRVAGYDMYIAALVAGVPLVMPEQLPVPIANDLRPTDDALAAFRAYYTQTGIPAGPLERMVHDHMSCYLSYRWQMPQAQYTQQPFYRAAAQSTLFPKDAESLLDTQQALMNVLADVRDEMDRRTRKASALLNDPLIVSPFAANSALFTSGALGSLAKAAAYRSGALLDLAQDGVDARAAGVVQAAARWRQWASSMNQAEVRDAQTPERDMLTLVDALKETPVPAPVVRFFNVYVHDSMAGFAANDRVNEFLCNGFGIAKFRRAYFGDAGDAMTRRAVEQANAQAVQAASDKRAQRAKWDAEALEWRRRQPQWPK